VVCHRHTQSCFSLDCFLVGYACTMQLPIAMQAIGIPVFTTFYEECIQQNIPVRQDRTDNEQDLIQLHMHLIIFTRTRANFRPRRKQVVTSTPNPWTDIKVHKVPRTVTCYVYSFSKDVVINSAQSCVIFYGNNSSRTWILFILNRTIDALYRYLF